MGAISRRAFLGCAAASAGSVWAGARPVGANDAIAVGVIGVGVQGARRMAGLEARADVRVVAVSDIHEDRKARVAAASRAAIHHRWEDLVARPDVDAVVIATSDHWHAPMILAALDAGKHVFCEPPLALDEEGARAVREKAAVAGRAVQVGADEALRPAWRRAGPEFIESGMLGALRWIQPVPAPLARVDDVAAAPHRLDWQAFLGSAPARPFDPGRYRHWRRYADYSAGAMGERFHGPLTALFAALGAQRPCRAAGAGGIHMADGRDTPDGFVATLEYPGGLRIVLSSATGARGDGATVIRGDRADLHTDGYDLRMTSEENAGAPPVVRRYGREEGDALRDWIEAIRGGRAPVCGPEIGEAAAVAVAWAARACCEGRTVTLPTGAVCL